MQDALICLGCTATLSAVQCTYLPICFTDNVGDNVGDIAGMGADLFGSFAESTCAALVISSVSTLGTEHVYVAMCYPLLISAVGILVCLVTTLIATDLKPARGINEIQSTLKWQLVIATVLATPVSCASAIQSPRYSLDFALHLGLKAIQHTWAPTRSSRAHDVHFQLKSSSQTMQSEPKTLPV